MLLTFAVLESIRQARSVELQDAFSP